MNDPDDTDLIDEIIYNLGVAIDDEDVGIAS